MGLANENYPNIELLVYKAKQMLANDDEFKAAYEKLKEENKYAVVDFDVVVFSQIWGSTCTGFDICSDGSSTVGGCAMTKEYTTIVEETQTGSHIVFFGDRACYKVTNANGNFYEDIEKHRMASLSEAKKRY